MHPENSEISVPCCPWQEAESERTMQEAAPSGEEVLQRDLLRLGMLVLGSGSCSEHKLELQVDLCVFEQVT